MVLYLLNVISKINKIMFVHILFVVITKQDSCGHINSGVSGNEILLKNVTL